nr:MAG TPA: hypothetical protein [Caudoviricetes sp.]
MYTVNSIFNLFYVFLCFSIASKYVFVLCFFKKLLDALR